MQQAVGIFASVCLAKALVSKAPDGLVTFWIIENIPCCHNLKFHLLRNIPGVAMLGASGGCLGF